MGGASAAQRLPVVFSIIIMIVVLFFRQGIMGTRELPDLFRKKVQKGGAVK